jgi:hypothetical protein
MVWYPCRMIWLREWPTRTSYGACVINNQLLCPGKRAPVWHIAGFGNRTQDMSQFTLYKCLQLHERTGGSIGVPNDVTRAAVTPSSFPFAPYEVILFLRPCNVVKSPETGTQMNQKLVLRATNRRQDVKWCPLHQCPVVVCAVPSAVDGSPLPPFILILLLF